MWNDIEYSQKCQQMRTEMLKRLVREKLDAKQKAKLENVLIGIKYYRVKPMKKLNI